MRKLILFLLTLGLGAVGYSLLRTERRSAAPRPARPRPPDPRPTSPRPPGPRPAPPPPEPSPAGGRCAARTRSGRPCSRDAEPGSRFCWQHQA